MLRAKGLLKKKKDPRLSSIKWSVGRPRGDHGPPEKRKQVMYMRVNEGGVRWYTGLLQDTDTWSVDVSAWMDEFSHIRRMFESTKRNILGPIMKFRKGDQDTELF